MNKVNRKFLDGTNFEYYDTQSVVNSISKNSYSKFNYTSKILAENLIRMCSDENLSSYLSQIIEKKRDLDFPWYPTRVVCHDILGQTAFVDLAGLRDAISKKGGDPSKVNPIVPTQLVVDHSLSVEHSGNDLDALKKNRLIENRRNSDRFHFIDWISRAFKNVDIIQPGNGILHQINLEKMSPVIHVQDGILFPDTLVGTDSHTPMVDALGVIAIGVGGLEAETVMLGKPSWMRLPKVIGVNLKGAPKSGVTATDIVLTLTQFLRRSNVISSFLEFFGEGVQNLTLSDRATISNMTPEFGATAAIFHIDSHTINYLKLTDRPKMHIDLVESYAKKNGLWYDSFKEAEYDLVLNFDLSSVERVIAGPSNPHTKVPTSKLGDYGFLKNTKFEKDLMPDGAIIIAAITSCTNTSNPKNMITAGLLARNACKLGLFKKKWVKSSLAPGSKTVTSYLDEAGLLKSLEKLGFGVVGYACTSCNGMSGAIDPIIQKEINDRNINVSAVLSGNRNFDGRIHPFVKEAFLASPPLVVAYAIAGTIFFDIEKGTLGYDKNGIAITLNDIWPKEDEIKTYVNSFVKPEHFQKVYTAMFSRNYKKNEPISFLYDWRPNSTYIRRPPYWEGALAKKRKLREMRPLAILGDNITTDHISPSNAIMKDSAAGEYLSKMGLPEEDFNSYATHRGDHLTAIRATFANPKLKNEMVKENGSIKQGSLTRIEPEGKIIRMWEAIENYMKKNQSLIVIAGKDYGQGSSRDWAAKGIRLAGVEVIVAEGFERIHRTNLIGMGVLPLEFIGNKNRGNLKIDGTEVFEVYGERKASSEIDLIINRLNGDKEKVKVMCRLDTAEEVKTYEAGGVLQLFAKDFLESESN